MPSPSTETVNQPNIDSDKNAQLPAEDLSKRIDLLLQEHEYAEAIKLAAKEFDESSSDKAADGYVSAMIAGLIEAETLMHSQSYASAAQLLKTVKSHYPVDKTMQQKLPWTSTQIDDAADLCIQKMMVTGLMAYRSGDFTEAIETWEKILMIDPRHAAAMNSLQTTEMQLSKLKHLNQEN